MFFNVFWIGLPYVKICLWRLDSTRSVSIPNQHESIISSSKYTIFQTINRVDLSFMTPTLDGLAYTSLPVKQLTHSAASYKSLTGKTDGKHRIKCSAKWSFYVFVFAPEFHVPISTCCEVLTLPSNCIDFCTWNRSAVQDDSSFPIVYSIRVLIIIATAEKQSAVRRKWQQDNSYSVESFKPFQLFSGFYVPYVNRHYFS